MNRTDPSAAAEATTGESLLTTGYFTQDQLAKAANLSRYPTGTILRTLARQGLINLGYGTITIVDDDRLGMIVNEPT